MSRYSNLLYGGRHVDADTTRSALQICEGVIEHRSQVGRWIFHVMVGPNEGKVYRGLYQLDHDILKANFAFPGNERPTSFSASDGQVYEVWQRVRSIEL